MLAPIFTSFIDVPSLVCMNPKYLNWSNSSSAVPFIHDDRWPWLDAVDEDFAFVSTDFHAVTSRVFL